MPARKGSDIAREACAGCGRSTAAGTALFSDRRSIESETGSSLLCADCQASLAVGRRDDALNKDRAALEGWNRAHFVPRIERTTRR